MEVSVVEVSGEVLEMMTTASSGAAAEADADARVAVVELDLLDGGVRNEVGGRDGATGAKDGDQQAFARQAEVVGLGDGPRWPPEEPP